MTTAMTEHIERLEARIAELERENASLRVCVERREADHYKAMQESDDLRAQLEAEKAATTEATRLMTYWQEHESAAVSKLDQAAPVLPANQCAACNAPCDQPLTADEVKELRDDYTPAQVTALKWVPLQEPVGRCDMQVGPCSCGAWHQPASPVREVPACVKRSTVLPVEERPRALAVWNGRFLLESRHMCTVSGVAVQSLVTEHLNRACTAHDHWTNIGTDGGKRFPEEG